MQAQRSVNTTVARASETDKTAAEVDVDAIVKDLQEKVAPSSAPRSSNGSVPLHQAQLPVHR